MKILCLLFSLLGLLMAIDCAGLEIPVSKHQTLNKQLPLSNYQTQKAEEKKIVRLLQAYENAGNRYDPVDIYETYSAGAQISECSNDANAPQWQDKKAYFSVLKEKLEKWELYKFTLQLWAPNSIVFQKNMATAEIPYLLYSLSQDYWEKGIYRFDFKKEGDRWGIYKSKRTIIDLRYIP